jgi:thioredoxin-like negative regulator of GroEL
MFKPVMQQISQEMGVAVNYINVDYDASLTQKYSVSSVPTIVITGQDGSVWLKHSGAMSPQQLKETFSRFR